MSRASPARTALAALAARLLPALSVLVIAALAAMLLLSLLVPMYTDEIGSKLHLSRMLVEGGRVVSLLPQCRSSWIQPVPVSTLPAALYYHLVFLPLGLLGHKVSAIVLAFVWFGAAACAIARRTKDRRTRLHAIASFAALHAAGTVPFTLVTGRAEPTMAIALGIFAVFPLAWPIERLERLWQRALAAAAFCFVASLLYASAFKALFFTPFVLLSAVLTFRRKLGWLAPVCAAVTATALQTNSYAKTFISCAEAPIVQAVLRSVSLDPGRAFREPGAFAKEGLGNLGGRAVDVADGMAIAAPHPWLPPATAEHLPEIVRLADGLSRALLYATMVGVPLLLIVAVVGARRRPEARATLALAAALLVGLGGHVFLAHHWNFYMTPLVVCVLALVAAMSASTLRLPDRALFRAIPKASAAVLQVAALAVMVTTLAHVGPHLVRVARLEGTVLPGQPAYVPALGFSAERPKIRAHAARCGIEGDGARRLVVDDATIFAFEDLREPLHLIYVTDAAMWGHDMPGEKNVALLRELGARGIISRCSYFPTALEPKAKRDDGYCCVGADDLR